MFYLCPGLSYTLTVLMIATCCEFCNITTWRCILEWLSTRVVSVKNHYHRKPEGIIILSVGILHDLKARLWKMKKEKMNLPTHSKVSTYTFCLKNENNYSFAIYGSSTTVFAKADFKLPKEMLLEASPKSVPNRTCSSLSVN